MKVKDLLSTGGIGFDTEIYIVNGESSSEDAFVDVKAGPFRSNLRRTSDVQGIDFAIEKCGNMKVLHWEWQDNKIRVEVEIPKGYQIIQEKNGFYSLIRENSEIVFDNTLHDRMCKWIFDTADHYDIVDSFGSEENMKQELYENTVMELAQIIKEQLDNDTDVIYVYDNENRENAFDDGEKLLKEYKEFSKKLGKGIEL